MPRLAQLVLASAAVLVTAAPSSAEPPAAVYHPDPVDYWRWTSAGLRKAVGDAGLEIVRFEGIMGLTATGLQLVQDAWYWRLPRALRPLWALVVQSLIKLAERVEPPAARDLNALVFAVVAEKP